MKKFYFLHDILLVLVLVFMSCTNDDDLNPSGLDKNWYALEDDPANPLKHLVYELYQAYQVPIFYNDTIGMEQRGVDGDGNPVIHYQLLRPTYMIDMMDPNYHFITSQRDDQLLKSVQFLKQYVLNVLPKEAMPRCYFLVDSIYKIPYAGAYPVLYDTYRGLQVVVIAGAEQIPNMTGMEQKELAAKIIAPGLASYILARYPEKLSAFYALTNGVLGKKLYGFSMTYDSTPNWNDDATEFGFIDMQPYASILPTEKEDVEIYVRNVFVYTEDEFRACWGHRSVVLAKYAIMKQVVADALAKK